MNFRQDKEAFYERFGIDIEIKSNKEQESGFRTYIENILVNIDYNIDYQDIDKYCGKFGLKTQYVLRNGFRESENMFNCIVSEKNFSEYLFKIQYLFNIPFKDYNVRDQFYNDISEAFDTTYLPIRIIKEKKQVLVIPEGCQFLDNEIIIKTLKFLDDKSHKKFIEGLQEYQNKNYIGSVEKMRRTTEEYLRHILQNDCGLKQNISNVQKELKKNSLSEIRNIIFKTLQYMDDLYNSHSKHNDGDIGENECEFVIYQTGVLLRYISKALKE